MLSFLLQCVWIKCEECSSGKEKQEFEHYQVAGGEPGSLKNLSPIMVDDRVVDVGRLHQTFVERSRHIKSLVQEFVHSILDDFQHPRS